ncbi:hypothetical protein [Enterobacter hormaechei]|uniref:hypothetical protein n=1 Tax=Enterobacter hormaechei TaxID=158836 RepID=UPI000649A02B|nr:hypothetical protein [Enterobacter hormaechei]KLQ76407.1 hypothetical protein ABF63_20800 [Enterobacter hormaechei subsp. steigerwaltii]
MKGRRYTEQEIDYLKTLMDVQRTQRLALLAEFGISEVTLKRILKDPERFLGERGKPGIKKGTVLKKQLVVWYSHKDQTFTLLGRGEPVQLEPEELTGDKVPFQYFKDKELQLVQAWSEGISLSYSRTKYIRSIEELSSTDTIKAFKDLLERFRNV